jgi:dsRNA-specific ribonuclease
MIPVLRITSAVADGECVAVADRILQTQVSNDNLQRLCRLHGLDQFINLNPSSRGNVSPRTMYDTMEAILGAVAEDGGEVALRAVMHRLGFFWP